MEAPRRTFLTILRQRRLAPALVLTVAMLAAVNWVLSPDQALRWLRVMLTLPLLWLGLILWHHRTRRRLQERDGEATVTLYFASALSLGTIAVAFWQIPVLALEIWARLGDHGVDVDSKRRIVGFAIGATLIVIGNSLPKILTPFSMLPPDLASLVTRARRFVGTCWVLLGLATLCAFLVEPAAFAMALTLWAVVLGIVMMLGAIVWMNVTAMKRDP